MHEVTFLRLAAFIIGAIFGSFANVLIYRLPRDMSIVYPASHCPKCNHKLAWYDNIPIISYIILGGRCRYCKAPISLRYPLVELITGVLSVAALQIAYSGPWPLLSMETGLAWALYFAFFFSLIVITFSDLETLEVPYLPVLIGTIAGIAFNGAFGPYIKSGFLQSLLGLTVAALPAMLIIVVYKFLFHREGMGFGDVLILGMVGSFVGIKGVIPVYFLSSLQGIVVALIYYIAGGKSRYPEEDLDEEEKKAWEEEADKHPLRLMALPFGPFIAIAALEWVFFQGWFMKMIERLFGL